MISLLDDWKILKSQLSVRFHDTKTRWWLSDETCAPLAESVTDAVRGICENVAPPHIEVVKRTIFEQTERKNVLRINHPEGSKQFFIVKVFLGDRKNLTADGKHISKARKKLRYRLRCSIYSLNEVARLLRAGNRGINTPKVFGYGHFQGHLYFVKASIIILEDLGDSTLEKMLLHVESDEERSRIFLRTVPLFVSLFKAHCNHIDVNNHAIILTGNKSESMPYLLDFQHANFHSKPSYKVLMFEASTLVKSCRSLLSNETIEYWLDELLDAVEINEASDRKKMKEYFDYYLNTSLSRKKCRRIC